MARTCRLCRHADRAILDAAIAAGDTYRSIAKQAGVSAASVFRHRPHALKVIARAEQAPERSSAAAVRVVTRAEESKDRLTVESIVSRLGKLEADTRHVLEAALRDNDHRLTLGAIKELREQAEAFGRLARDVAAARSSMLDGAGDSTSARWRSLSPEDKELTVRGVTIDFLARLREDVFESVMDEVRQERSRRSHDWSFFLAKNDLRELEELGKGPRR
jgi:hypothetical protein